MHVGYLHTELYLECNPVFFPRLDRRLSSPELGRGSLSLIRSIPRSLGLFCIIDNLCVVLELRPVLRLLAFSDTPLHANSFLAPYKRKEFGVTQSYCQLIPVRCLGCEYRGICKSPFPCFLDKPARLLPLWLPEGIESTLSAC